VLPALREMLAKQRRHIAGFCVLLAGAGRLAPAVNVVDPSTLKGKLLFGYQGWFDASGSGSPNKHGSGGWVHWSPGVPPNATNCTFDVWPAMGEYPPTSSFPTQSLHSRRAPHGPMSLFSDFPASTQDLHFRWMREYGIDGVFVQRFVNELQGGACSRPGCFKDAVLSHALRAAEANGRVLSVMYDISGAQEDKWAATILKDWHHLLQDLKVTQSKAWLHHQGMPVVSVWGVGFNSHPGSPVSSLAFLEQLRAITPITYVGGVPTHWRTCKGDSKPGYENVYEAMDVLSPWLVGRYDSNVSFASNMKNVFVQDAAQAKRTKQGYAPVVFPGFSWSNLMRTTGAGAISFNQIPRHQGQFWSYQAHSFATMADEPLFICTQTWAGLVGLCLCCDACLFCNFSVC
jgi:hypothetical protein